MKHLKTVLALLLCLCMLPVSAFAYTVDPAGSAHQTTTFTPPESGLYAVTAQKDGKVLSPLPAKAAIYDPALTVSVTAGDMQAQEVDYNVFWLVKGTRYTVQLKNVSDGAYDDSGEWSVSVARVSPTAVAVNADTWVEGEWFTVTPGADDTYTVSAASKPVFVEILTADSAAASGAWSSYALDKEKCRVGMELDYLRSLKAAIALRDEEIDLAEDAYEKALAKLENYNSLNQLASDTDMLDDTWSHVLVKKQTVYDLLKSLLRNHGDGAGTLIGTLFPNLNLPDIDPAVIDEMPANVEDLPDWLSERLQSQDGLVGEAKQKVDDLRAERAADQARYDAGIAANPQLEPLIEDSSAETATLRQKVQSDADAIMDGAAPLAAADAGLKLVAATWLNAEDDAMNVALTKDTAYVIHVLNNEPVSICVTSGGEEPPVLDVDKTALNRAINAAKAVDTSKYTDESVAAMQQALAEAEAVKANADATQAEVDAAARALNDAIAALVEKETPPDPPAVDKTALQKAISDAEAVDTSKYTDESVAAMQQALADAEAVKANADATQAEVDAAARALNDAIAALVEKETPPDPPAVDKTALQKAISDAEAVDTSKYTDESVAAMQQALTDAKAVNADADATQAEVDAAAKALNDAIAALVEKETPPDPPAVDKTALQKAISDAEAVDTSKYTDESVAAMQQALATARLVNANPFAKQERVDEVTAALLTAMENLVEKTAEIDKSALEAAIASAESVDRSKYTPESLSAMDSKLNYARAVLSDTTATQADVDKAASELNAAIAALVEKETPPAVDKTALNSAIAAAEAVDAAQYTVASVAAMQQALSAATNVRDNPNATQAQVDSATTTLNNAVNALQPKPSSGVDTSALEAAIASAEAVDRSRYTEDSLAAMDRQLQSARSTLSNPNATQTTVNLAARRLNNAVAALVEKTPVQPTKFVDVPESAYYADAVDWAVANGITTGMDATHFAPKSDCTRAQMVTFLWRTMNEPEPTLTASPFVDVQNPNAYYYKAVLWAVENEITTGTDKTHFSPNATVTRAQVVTFLWRMEGEIMPQSSISPFVDVKDSSAYYYYAVLWAVEKEITTGIDKTHFAPKDNCTRAQIVTFLYRDRVGV